MINDLRQAFVMPSVTHTFDVVDEASTTFRSEHVFNVKAAIRTRFFMRQFFWTGGGTTQEAPPELVCDLDRWGFPKHKIHGPVIVESKSRTLLVDLGRTVEIEEFETIHFRHKLKDLAGSFEPHLAHTPKAGTEIITLNVSLPASLAGKVYYEEVTVDTDSVIDGHQLQPTLEEDGRAHFSMTVNDCKTANRQYRIVWKSR